MLNYDNFAITLGRAVDVFRTSPDSVVQQKGALRALVALSSLGAVALRVEDGLLLAGGKPVPATLPFVPGLAQRMQVRGVLRLNIARGASAFDLLAIVRSLAAEDSEVTADAPDTLASVGADRIEIAPEELGSDRRPASVTMAFDRDEVLREAGEVDTSHETDSEVANQAAETGDVAPEGEAVAAVGPEESATGGGGEAADAAAVERVEQEETTVAAAEPAEVEDSASDSSGVGPPERVLEIAMLKLAGASEGDDVESLVGSVVEGVEARLESGSDAAALEGIACLVNLEPQVPTSLTRSYTDGIERLLSPETLVRLARLVADNRHARYAVAVLHRAGSAGTNALMEQLAKAPSVEEKDAYGAALVAVPEGVEGLRMALDSEDATVVMTAVDQLSKLNVTDSAAALGRKAAAHPDGEIRVAACGALCKMSVTDEVRAAIESLLASDSARLVARCVGPGAPDSLVELLITAADHDTDTVARKALCLALGRVGTPRATQQLIKMSVAGGRFFGRKPVEVRLAAIEGLGLIKGPAAMGTMEELAADRNPSIRGAARAIIDQRESGA